MHRLREVNSLLSEKLRFFRQPLIAAILAALAVLIAHATAEAQLSNSDDGTAVTTEDGVASVAHRVVFPFGALDDLTVYVLRPETLRPEGHKVLLFFVGGNQADVYARDMLPSLIAREAVKRGYIFVAPASPCQGCIFFTEKGDRYFPSLFEELTKLFPMAEPRFHLMGNSNGGRSSLHLGTQHPDWVASITTYPGYLQNDKLDLLERLSNTCVIMYVGRKDIGFYERHRKVVSRLRRLRRPVHRKTYFRKGHNIDPLWTEEGAEILMDGIDNRLGCPTEN